MLSSRAIPAPLLNFVRIAFCGAALLRAMPAGAQSVAEAWSGHGHDAQHAGISTAAAQPLRGVRWTMPVDLMPQYSNGNLLIHYGSPLVTRQNTLIVPVKTGLSDGFRVEARDPADGSLKWMQATDFMLQTGSWKPSCGIALTPKSRLYFPGAGGTVFFRDAPDAANPPPSGAGRIAFYGLANYEANPASFHSSVRISTPITSDRYGNIFFGFQVSGATVPALQSGIARIAEDGTGSWISAAGAAVDPAVTKVPMNCAPALSNDQRTLYIAASFGNYSGGYLVALDSRTLAPISRVRLKDVANPSQDALLLDSGTASPTVGPDGDVYFGVLESPFGSHNYRGWLLHFDAALSQTKIPGDFGWDNTPSIVPASAVPSYSGASRYLILAKYNSYVSGGGGGLNRVAVLDPNDTQTNPGGATIMKEILTKLGPTPDKDYPNVPGAVREWCINAAAVDPFTRCAIVHSEDGKVYRWDFATNSFTETLTLIAGIGEAYTSTVIGVDGTVYVIFNGTLFALGK